MNLECFGLITSFSQNVFICKVGLIIAPCRAVMGIRSTQSAHNRDYGMDAAFVAISTGDRGSSVQLAISDKGRQ